MMVFRWLMQRFDQGALSARTFTLAQENGIQDIFVQKCCLEEDALCTNATACSRTVWLSSGSIMHCLLNCSKTSKIPSA